MRSGSGHSHLSTNSSAFKINNLFAAFLLSIFVLVSVSAFAQSTTEGAVAGTIYDPQGAVVAGATVTVRNNGTNQEQTATTDSTGYFRITKLSPASYTVSVTAQGFAGYRARQVIVEVGRVTEIAPRLGISWQFRKGRRYGRSADREHHVSPTSRQCELGGRREPTD